ncbi:hypothetical protein SLS62_009086 [Diatrype stigma]|uniref:Acyltransferase MbtK/IucB-like conserved domain-containing protein n=1 Tax=Diatrype stigma TaxID=117547 RepID=A0AAN9YLY4_9PEZI
MAPSIVHLPDGQNFTVQPVFSGLFFKSNDLNTHPTPFPAGWTVVLHSEDNPDNDDIDGAAEGDNSSEGGRSAARGNHIHKYSKPTLQNDTVFISSISNPSSSDYRPPASASRQIALMVWITLYWYFQQPEPAPYLETKQSRLTPAAAKPKGEWRIRIKREGVLRTRNMIPKLERMGLICTMESAVGTGTDEGHQGWDHMFVTRSMFWQIPSGLFLFTLQPMTMARATSSHPGSPASSRPTSPIRSESPYKHHHHLPSTGSMLSVDAQSSSGVVAVPGLPIGPYFSPSGLPTYYPPPPLQYTITHNIRHPIRRKPPRMGEIFYTRFVPSVGKYLSFRVASLSPKPVPNLGPITADPQRDTAHQHLCMLDDTSLLQMWLAKPRVSAFWGQYHATFLSDALRSRHSFPVIGLWDGVPFGYFEIYWVKEDALGRHMGMGTGGAQDFDRGLHVLVGEEWARGRVQQWLSGLVHWCWQVENRTMNIYLEPRVDNERLIKHLQTAGFSKEREIAFPHKQSCLCRLQREVWEGPAL